MSTSSALGRLVHSRSQLAIFARDVLDGLSAPQKQLQPQYFYDEVGSALFEAITLLPEYGLTRADERTIIRCAPELAAALDGEITIVELGSGSGSKTRHILREFSQRPGLVYSPVDVSMAALTRCRAELERYCPVNIVYDTYLSGLSAIAAKRVPGRRLLVLFLGSTIGNFSLPAAQDFLARICEMLDPGDAMLLGADLVKDVGRLLLAYDDPAGVTSAFNKNLLCRINRELRADFKLDRFRHEARYNEHQQRIEMHLRALERHTVVIDVVNRSFPFEENETIWTESSHKFTTAQLTSLAVSCGFEPSAIWQDEEWPFAECLWIVRHSRPYPGQYP